MCNVCISIRAIVLMVMKTRHVRVHLYWCESERDRPFIKNPIYCSHWAATKNKEKNFFLRSFSLSMWMNHRKFNTWCKRYVPVAHDVCLWLAHVVDQVGGRGDEEGGTEAEEQVASAGLLGRSVQDPILQVIPEVYDRVLEVTFTTLGDKTKLIISYRNRVMSGPVDQKRLSSQELSRCRARGESGDHIACRWWSTQAMVPHWLWNIEQTSPEVYHWAHKKE